MVEDGSVVEGEKAAGSGEGGCRFRWTPGGRGGAEATFATFGGMGITLFRSKRGVWELA